MILGKNPRVPSGLMLVMYSILNHLNLRTVQNVKK